MFIMTEKHEIINLNYCARIKVNGNEINASVEPTILGDKGDQLVSITVASFDAPMDADYALYDLLKAITDGNKPIWNVNTVKSLSSVWNTIKTEHESLPLMNKVELSVSGVDELTITYPSYYKGAKDVDRNIETVKAELQKKLCGEPFVIVGPEFADN